MARKITQKSFDGSRPRVYQIRVWGHLDASWNSWFDGMDVQPTPDGETVLTGSVIDQAALHGLLSKVRDLGLPLLSVTLLPPD